MTNIIVLDKDFLRKGITNEMNELVSEITGIKKLDDIYDELYGEYNESPKVFINTRNSSRGNSMSKKRGVFSAMKKYITYGQHLDKLKNRRAERNKKLEDRRGNGRFNLLQLRRDQKKEVSSVDSV